MNPEQIKEDWNSRGYSFGIFKDPPGQVWADFVHKTDELVVLAEGEIEIEIEGKSLVPLRLVRKFLYLLKLGTQSGMSVRQITPGITDTKNNILPKSCNCTFRLYFSCFLTGIVLNKF